MSRDRAANRQLPGTPFCAGPGSLAACLTGDRCGDIRSGGAIQMQLWVDVMTIGGVYGAFGSPRPCRKKGTRETTRRFMTENRLLRLMLAELAS
ncbi:MULTISPECIES: hypothetical protein [unclassified Pseudomonas]|uniref:hypothetical protein n=1 Tax=unclassified Pseudomonas TaxID=196821 RepID=UPI002AC99315|nr:MULTISPECIES: hypothetical protein [unclassified Pseudomonas]MEB0039993.1 hypothetical protein [Pseudomonas sp. MH10]MEB0119517.1 hypothetical protein [Pseudomonas sp. CCI1.2]WPX65127.1 hypothetical protein RHM59_05470 [Pseudomonas sp. MH10]